MPRTDYEAADEDLRTACNVTAGSTIYRDRVTGEWFLYRVLE